MHKNIDELYKQLWDQYTSLSPQVKNVFNCLTKQGEAVVNDHVAFRTFNTNNLGIESLAREFKKFGYVEKGQYYFKEKRLNAKHYETDRPDFPKVFISELIVESLSPPMQKEIQNLVQQIPVQLIESPEFCYSGRPWKMISHDLYNKLYTESEYAAWLSVFGFCANHFTVYVNKLKSFKNLELLNNFLKANNFKLNSSGGEIKGSKDVYLEQSSTMADHCRVQFSDGVFEVPSVYYEFALRYSMPNGQMYQGFVEKSANKIFESTHRN